MDPLGLVICCGMYRSGSTWQFDVARHLAGGPPVCTHPDGEGEGPRVLKTHVLHEPLRAALRSGARGLYTYRDVRDVVPSLARFLGCPPDEVIERWLPGLLEHDRTARAQPGTLVQRYEDVVSLPARATRQVADHLGVSQSDELAALAAWCFSLTETRRRVREAGAGANNYQRLLLRPRAGEVGAWRWDLTPRQVRDVEAAAGGWLEENGYPCSR